MSLTELLNKYKSILASHDKDYSAKYNKELLFDEKKEYHAKMNNGCREMTKRLSRINYMNLSTSELYLSDYILNSKESGSKHLYFYLGCDEFQNFVKEFNNRDKNIQIKFKNNNDNLINKISVDPDGVKKNKIIYNLERDDRDYYLYHNSHNYYGIHPDIHNVFMC